MKVSPKLMVGLVGAASLLSLTPAQCHKAKFSESLENECPRFLMAICKQALEDLQGNLETPKGKKWQSRKDMLTKLGEEREDPLSEDEKKPFRALKTPKAEENEFLEPQAASATPQASTKPSIEEMEQQLRELKLQQEIEAAKEELVKKEIKRREEEQRLEKLKEEEARKEQQKIQTLPTAPVAAPQSVQQNQQPVLFGYTAERIDHNLQVESDRFVKGVSGFVKTGKWGKKKKKDKH